MTGELSGSTDRGAGLRLGAIWAQDRNGVIGVAGGIPWRIPEDFAHFKAATMGAPIIMGRGTWESLGAKPLPGRANLVVSRTLSGGGVFSTLESAISAARARTDLGNEGGSGPAGGEYPVDAWIIGGGQLYAQALPLCDLAVVSQIDMAVERAEGEAVFAPSLDGWRVAENWSDQNWRTSKNGQKWRVRTFLRP